MSNFKELIKSLSMEKEGDVELYRDRQFFLLMIMNTKFGNYSVY